MSNNGAKVLPEGAISSPGKSMSAAELAAVAKDINQDGISEYSLGIFGKTNPVRLFCLRAVDANWFKYTVLALILGNCVFLAMTEPFPTCCTEAELSDDSVQKLDMTNFTVRCDMNNEIIDGATFEPIGEKCCIDEASIAGDPFEKCASYKLRNLQENIEIWFNIMFTIEMAIKVIALGVIRAKGSYLRDSWNILDFVVVFVSWLSMIPGVANLSALRTFRVLRPLRTLSSIPGMRPVVSAMMACVMSMFHVAMLCCFLFTVFGIIGLQLFSGTLKGRCHYVDPSMGVGSYESSISDEFSFMSILGSDEAPCALPCNLQKDADGKFIPSAWTRSADDCLELSGGTCFERGSAALVNNPWYDPDAAAGDTVVHTVTLPSKLLEGLPAEDPNGFWVAGAAGNFTQIYDKSSPYVELTSFCLDTGENQLGDGFANFDNIGYSWLTIFTSITLEGWVDVMYGIQASFGHTFVVFLYFFFMVWLCSFFMLELTLAVINDAYDNAREEEEQRVQEKLELLLEQSEQAAAAKLASPDQSENTAPSTDGKDIAAVDSSGDVKEEDATPQKRPVGLKPWGPAPVRMIFRLVESPIFTFFVTFLIVLNTVTLGLEAHGMSQEKKDMLEAANVVFTYAFLAELVLKMIGLNPRQYFSDFFNVFDFIIVVISIVEMFLADEGGGSGLGALRTFRLMRIFKLARSWKNLRRLLQTILLSIMDVTNAAILLVIIMFIFTLLGMQLFGGKWNASYFCDDPSLYDECKAETPRANFDSFWWGFVTVFQILTGENWNEVMYIGKRVSGEISWVYFVSLNVIGNYMVLNLFLAILLARFEADDEEEDEEGTAVTGSAQVAPMPILDSVEDTRVKPPHAASLGNSVPAASSASLSTMSEAPPATNPNKMTMNPTAKSCFVFAPDMPLRQWVFELVNSGSFDNVILVLIGVSTVLLAVEEPWVDECKDTTCSSLGDFLFVMDIVLNVLFTGEMLLKMFALGIIGHKNSYLRGGWNILDFCIVGISLASLSLGGGGAFKALKSLRSLRALRPLRVISRSPGMRLVVNSIIAALPAILNVSVVVSLFYLIFAIVAVQNFSGGMNSCNDPGVAGPTKFDCLGYNTTGPPVGFAPLTWYPSTETDSCGMLPTDELIEGCLKNGTLGSSFAFPRVWAPNGGFENSYNFDNVGNALLIVFEVVSGEMWPDIMYSTMDIVGPDEPMLEWPHRQNTGVAIWYMLVTLVCAFLMINIFVGVIIDNFNKMKSEQEGSALLTPEQKVWIETMKKALEHKPIKLLTPPTSPNRLKAWNIVTSNKFEVLIMGIILLNTFTMMLVSDDMDDSLKLFCGVMNYVFLGLFTIEAGLKLFAMGKQYFKLAWNCFDCTLVLFGYLGVIGGLGPMASLLRIFRVARIFRLLRTSQGLLTIFRTLIYSIPSIMNVGSIFCLLLIIFSILGMNLFSGIKHGELLNENANFETFFGSMQTLFRVSTGESFNGIMHDCMLSEPYCSEEAGNCGFPVFAPIYFCGFFLLSAYTLLSMITAIILDNFNENTAMSHNSVTEEHIDQFKEQWAVLDPKGSMFINEELLVKLVMNIPFPLGVRDAPVEEGAVVVSNRKRANQLIRTIDVPSIRGRVAFNDVLRELTSKAMPSIDIPEENTQILNMKKVMSVRQHKTLSKLGTSRENIMYNAGQVAGITIIQSAMRGFIQRTKLEELTSSIEKAENSDGTPPTSVQQ